MFERATRCTVFRLRAGLRGESLCACLRKRRALSQTHSRWNRVCHFTRMHARAARFASTSIARASDERGFSSSSPSRFSRTVYARLDCCQQDSCARFSLVPRVCVHASQDSASPREPTLATSQEANRNRFWLERNARTKPDVTGEFSPSLQMLSSRLPREGSGAE
jgi:hypothetical protein